MPEGETVRDYLINHEKQHTALIVCNAANGYTE